MANFAECLAANVTTKKLNKKRADAITKRYFEHLEEAEKALGAGDRAEKWAAEKAVETVTKLNNAKVRARVKDIRTAAAYFKRFQTSSEPDVELIKIALELQDKQRAILANVDAISAESINLNRPKLAGLKRGIENTDEIIDALYGGSPTNEAARIVADDLVKIRTYLTERANMHGASIEIPPAGRLNIVNNSLKLRRAIQRGRPIAEVRQEWVDDWLHRTDWSLMDKELAEATKENILEDRFDAFVTEGNSERSSGIIPPSLSERLNGRNHTLYPKDAASWKYLNEKYGAGDIWQQMVSERETFSKDAALLEMFGSNPEIMLTSITRRGGMARARAALLTVSGKGTPKLEASTRAEASSLNDQVKMFSHLVSNGEHSATIQIWHTFKSMISTAVLSGAFLSNLGDVGFAVHESQMLKIPAVRLLPEMVKNFASMPSGEFRKHAMRSGLIADGALEQALQAQRYLGAFDGYHKARLVSDFVFRMQLLNAWTQSSRWTWGMHLMGAFADHKDVGFNDLPFRETLERYNIGRAEWDLLRSTPINGEGAMHILRPIDLAQRGDLDKALAQRASDKFFMMISDTGRRAVPTYDLRTGRALGRHLDADTLTGQTMRTIGTLKTFPMFIMMTHLREGLMQKSLTGKMAYITRLVGMMTIMGAFITQLKEINKGRDPREMFSSDPGVFGGEQFVPFLDDQFWLRAMLNGGSLGFLGDAVLGGINAARGGGLSQAVAGPVVEAMEGVRDIGVGALTGDEDFVKDTAEFGAQYFPIPWEFKLATQRLILDDILEWADPKLRTNALRRERRRKKERGQDSWWRPYDRTPARAPDFTQMIGR